MPLSAGSVYVEGTNGDLSDDYLNPTSLVFTPGVNTVSGALAGGAADLDLFTFNLSSGQTLTEIKVIDFTGGAAGSLFAMQSGTQLSSDPVLATINMSFPDPIANVLISSTLAASDFDILPNLVVGPPFNFANPLPAGDYVVWLNETGAASTYSLDFTVVPEPSTLMLFSLASAVMLFRRRS
ncbi:MAG: PEP-CTERM sorting domain-containing protein [Verrucomicrobiota bacterium]